MHSLCDDTTTIANAMTIQLQCKYKISLISQLTNAYYYDLNGTMLILWIKHFDKKQVSSYLKQNGYDCIFLFNEPQ